MKWGGIALAGYLVAWMLLVSSAFVESNDTGGSVSVISVALLVVSGILYLICLGMLAVRTGRSMITWVGLTIILSPFSYLFAYPMLRGRVQNDAKRQSAA